MNRKRLQIWIFLCMFPRSLWEWVREWVSEWVIEWVSEWAGVVSEWRRQEAHFRDIWRLWPKILKKDLMRFIFKLFGTCGWKYWKCSFWCSFSCCLDLVADNSENGTSETDFPAVWNLWPKLLKIELQNCIFELFGTCSPKYWNRASGIHFEPV